MKLAVLHHHVNKAESIWHVQLAVLVAIALQLSLNSRLIIGPKFVIAGLEVLLLIALAIIRPNLKKAVFHLRRALAIVFIAIISVANILSLWLVIYPLFNGVTRIPGRELIISAVAIYLTNIIIFGLWYWELDRNETGSDSEVDFLFPQMGANKPSQADWQPTFIDYLYISITNGTAFSPTDAMPLTHRAKALMTLQSITSLITIALVAARAVNILS